MDISSNISDALNTSGINSYVGTVAYASLSYAVLSQTFRHIERSKSLARSLSLSSKNAYSKYIPLYEGFVGYDSAHSVDQVMNYYRSKGYFRQRPEKYEPISTGHRTIFEAEPDRPIADLTSVLSEVAPEDSLVDIQKATFGILGGTENKYTIGELSGDAIAKAKYVFSGIDEYTEFINEVAGTSRFGSSSYQQGMDDFDTTAKNGNSPRNKFIDEYLDNMINTSKSTASRERFNERFPGVLAVLNEVTFNKDAVKPYGNRNRVRVGGVIEKRDRFLLSLINFDEEKHGASPAFLRSLKETNEAISRGDATRIMTSFAKSDDYNNVRLNGSIYQYTPELLDGGSGNYAAKTFELQMVESLIAHPSSRTSISSLHAIRLNTLVEKEGMSPLEALDRYINGLQYRHLKNARVDVPAHGVRVSAKQYDTLGLSAKVAQSGDTNAYAVYNQAYEGKNVSILGVPDVKRNPFDFPENSPFESNVAINGITNISRPAVIRNLTMVSQGEGTPSMRGLLEVYYPGLHNAASASNAGRVANVFARGSAFESIKPRWTPGVEKYGVTNDARYFAKAFSKQLDSRMIYGSFGNMSRRQAQQMRGGTVDRRAGLISNYMLISQSELAGGNAITEGASAVVRRQTIPGVLPEFARSGIEHVETIKLAANMATGEVPRSTLNAINVLTVKYQGDANRAKKELGADTVIGYDYRNPTRKITLGDISDDVTHVEVKSNMINRYGYVGLTVHRAGYVQQEKDTLKNTVSHFITPEYARSLFSKGLSKFVRDQYASVAKTVTHVASLEESITKSEGRIALGLAGDILSRSIDSYAKQLNKLEFNNVTSSYIETDKSVDQAMAEYLDFQLKKIDGISDADEINRLTKLAKENTTKYRYEYEMVVRKHLLEKANASSSTHKVFAAMLGITDEEARRSISSFEYGMDSDTIIALMHPDGMNAPTYQLANFNFESTVRRSITSKDSAAELVRMLNRAQPEVDRMLGNLIPSGHQSRSKGIGTLYKIWRDLGAEDESNSESLAEKSISVSAHARSSVLFRDGTLKGLNLVLNTLGNLHKASDAPTSFAHTSAPGINGYIGGAKITYEGLRNTVIYGSPKLQNYFSSMLSHNTQYVTDKIHVRDILKHSRGNPVKYAMNKKNLAGNWVFSRDMSKFEIQDIGTLATALDKLSNQSYVIEAFDKLNSEKIVTGSENLSLQGKAIFAELFGINKDQSKIDVGDVLEAMTNRPDQIAVASEIADELQKAMGGKDLPMLKLPAEIADEVGQSHIPLLRTSKDQKFKFDTISHLVNGSNKSMSFTTGDAAVQANLRIMRQYALAKSELEQSIQMKVTDEHASEKNRKLAIDRIRNALREYDTEISQMLAGKGSVAASSVGNFRLPFSGNGRIKASNRVGFNEVGILKDRFLMMVTHGNLSDYDEVLRYHKFQDKAIDIVDNIKQARTSIDYVKSALKTATISQDAATHILNNFNSFVETSDRLKSLLPKGDFSFGGVSIESVFSELDGLIKSSHGADGSNLMDRVHQINKVIDKISHTVGSSIEILPEKIKVAELASAAIREAEKGMFFVRIQGYPEINATSGKYAKVKLFDYGDREMYGSSYKSLIKDFQRTQGFSKERAIAEAKRFVLEGQPNFLLNSASAKAISRDFDGDALSFILTSLDHIAASAKKHGDIYKEILSSVSHVKNNDVIGLHIESIINHLADSAVITRTIEDKKVGKKTNGYFPASSSSLKAISAVEKSNEVRMNLTKTQAEVVEEMVSKTLESQGVTKQSKDYAKVHRELVTHITNSLNERYAPFVNDLYADTGSKIVSENILHNVYYLDTINTNSKPSTKGGAIEQAISKFKDLGPEGDILHNLSQEIKASCAADAVKLLRDRMEVDASRFNLIKGATPAVTSLGEQITNALIQNKYSQDSLAQFINIVATESLQQKTISSKKGTPLVEGYRNIFGKIADANHTFTADEVRKFISSDYEIFMDTKTRDLMRKLGFSKNGETHIEQTVVKYSEYEEFVRSKSDALNTIKTAYDVELENVQRDIHAGLIKDVNKNVALTGSKENFSVIRGIVTNRIKNKFKDSSNPFLSDISSLGIDAGTGYSNISHMASMVENDLEKVRKFKHGPIIQEFLKKATQSGKYKGMQEHEVFNDFVKQMRPYLSTYNGDTDSLLRQAMKAVQADYADRFPDLSEIMDKMKDRLIPDPKLKDTFHISSDNYSYFRDAQLLANMEQVNIVVHHPDDSYYKKLVERNIRADRRNMREYARAALDSDSSMMRSMNLGDILSGKGMRVNVSGAADDIERAMHGHGMMANVIALGAGVLGGMFVQQDRNGYAIPDLKVVQGRGGQYYQRTENMKTHVFGAESEVLLKKKPIRVVNTIEEGKRQGRIDSFIRNKEIAKRIADRDGSGAKRVDSRYAGVVI